MAEQNSILTESHRKFLKSNIRNTDEASTQRYRIRKRVRQGLKDFQILAKHLEQKDREMIFDAEEWSRERYELSKDVAKAIQFMYVGLGGEGNFRGPLRLAVSNGEQELGNVEHTFDAIPRFSVDIQQQTVPEQEIVDAVDSGDLDTLESPDLYTFLRRAREAKAIDFDRIRERMDFDDANVPPKEQQPDLEEVVDDTAEMMEMYWKALGLGVKELRERGELPIED